MPGETVTQYKVSKAVNKLYDYTRYDVRPAIEDKIVYELALQALYLHDEDPHPTEIDDRGFDIATWRGVTRFQLSGALPPAEILAREQELKVAFEEMGFEVQLGGCTSLEGDAPY